ncbi:MAG: hypothetical protein RL687_381 [Candidatus Parcubacteria bacterium]|jgi:hypothetical protein
MKKSTKYFLSGTLIINILFPISSFAETASPVVAIPAQSKFCSKFNEISSKLQSQISEVETKKKESEIKNETKIAEKESAVDAKKAEGRISADDKRIKNFDKTNTKAKTDKQKAAVVVYKKAMTDAVTARRTAVDTAVKSYRDSVSGLMSTKNTEIDSAIATFKTAVAKATDKANTDCANNIPNKIVSTEFNNAIKDAKTALSTSKKSFSKTAEVKALKLIRDTAFKEAETVFKSATDKARAELLIAIK